MDAANPIAVMDLSDIATIIKHQRTKARAMHDTAIAIHADCSIFFFMPSSVRPLTHQASECVGVEIQRSVVIKRKKIVLVHPKTMAVLTTSVT